jgi:transketolase
MALSAKHSGDDYKVYTILGDGEIEEGQVWEAAMFAAHKKLNNLVAFVDCNGLQIDGTVDEDNSPKPVDAKLASFGWNVMRVDGHDVAALRDAFRWAKQNRGTGKPTVIIAETTKGKGVSFMENDILWHYRTPQGEEYEAALKELEAQRP